MSITAEFIKGVQGQWLLTRWCSERARPPLLIIMPPFAEEANRSRRVFRQLAEALQTQHSYEVWLPDLYGTGDAAGDFSEIDFFCWQQDLADYLATISHCVSTISLLGCRFGAMQALDFYQRYPQSVPISQVCLWQPQLEPTLFWRQLWRQLQAANLVRQSNSIKPAELFATGQVVDLAGYAITSHFYNQINEIPSVLHPYPQLKIGWFDCASHTEVSAATKQQAARLQAEDPGVVRVQNVQSAFFWLQQEPVQCDELIALTIQFLTEAADVGS